MTTYYPTKLQAVLHAEEASQNDHNDEAYYVITTGNGGYYSTPASELEVTDRILCTYKNGLRVKAIETVIATFERGELYSPAATLIEVKRDTRAVYEVEYTGKITEYNTEAEAKTAFIALISSLITEEL